MFNPHVRLASICHTLLPKPGKEIPGHDTHPDRFKYLCYAVPAMIAAFHHAGVGPRDIDVKLFGGGNVLISGEHTHNEPVGTSNVRSARELLHAHKLQIKAANVGGLRGRKIIFNTLTGQVFHKILSRD
jgi:chemotaxis protein CheD